MEIKIIPLVLGTGQVRSILREVAGTYNSMDIVAPTILHNLWSQELLHVKQFPSNTSVHTPIRYSLLKRRPAELVIINADRPIPYINTIIQSLKMLDVSVIVLTSNQFDVTMRGPR